VREWKYDKLIQKTCRLHMPAAWDWLIFKALVKQESRFNPNAVSHAGAGGLTQLMPATARELGLSPEDRFVPRLSIDGGARYLRKMWNIWKAEKDGTEHNWERTRFALGSYNGGAGTVLRAQRYADRQLRLPTDRWESIAAALRHVQKGWRETTGYVTKIVGYYAEYRTQQAKTIPRTDTVGPRSKPKGLSPKTQIVARKRLPPPLPPASPSIPKPDLMPRTDARPVAPASEPTRVAARGRRRLVQTSACAVLVYCAVYVLIHVSKRRGRG